MNIVVPDGHITNPGDLSWDRFARLGHLQVYDYTPPEEMASRLAEADAVLINGTSLSGEAIRRSPHLRYVGLLSTGYNNVDLPAARERGVIVTNIPEYSTMAVAQHAMALLLEICNQVGYYSRTVKEGRWAASRDACYWDSDRPLIELSGLTCGVVGYGHIGSAFAAMALAMGMHVLANRRRRDVPPDDPRVRYADLGEVFAEADVISLHTPLTDSTMGMINARTLAAMRPGVILINASRGKLVVEADLAAALAQGRVRAYGADVVAVEPVLADNPLLAAPRVFLTPHMAWAPLATRRRLLDMAFDNFQAYLRGAPINIVG